ncbi:MAG: hypothetical protein MUO64_18780 [Anaerolineales bacterium]|nr:hypothetical protein [Anaerolineales bacterium]
MGRPFPLDKADEHFTRLREWGFTMFTLFFGGNDFAPKTKVNGEPVQEFLQRHC